MPNPLAAIWRPGLAPGTLLADPNAHPTVLRILRFDAGTLVEETPESPEGIADPVDGAVLWLDVVGVGDVELVRRIGHRFSLHPLVLEDVVNVGQRSKMESYGDAEVFFTARMPIEQAGRFETEQLAMVLRPGLLVTFQERPGDCFELVRERLRLGNPRIRRSGADYLAYALLDAVVDAYAPHLDRLGDELDDLEEAVIESSAVDHLPALHGRRSDLTHLRRSILPLREALSGLVHASGPSPFTSETRLFLRDAYDHAVRAVERADAYRETAASVLELHLTMAAHRSNEVMKVLTMMATIFIPLSFLVGLYGMNFDTSSPWNMPELGSRYGYPILLGLMATAIALQVWWFKRKGWF